MEKTLPFAEIDENQDLRRFIISRIREGGPVTFHQFMKWCLYHREFGYYCAGNSQVGKGGDFFTSPCVHPLFGAMVGRQLSEMCSLLGGETFTVLEAGAGRGLLCKDIISWAARNDPAFYDRMEYCILEISPSMLEEQKQRLYDENLKGKVRWLAPGELSEGGVSFAGCILSNEFMDAFPLHRVFCEGEKLRECYVGYEDGEFVEILQDLSDPRLDAYFADQGISLCAGQKAEVNLDAVQWFGETVGSLEKGFVMTIDYGGRAEELYSPLRKDGTLRCYFRHRLSHNPYERIGKQDITADVNFSALIAKGEEMGVFFTGLTAQYRFLLSLGLIDGLAAAQKGLSELGGLRLRLSLKHLLEPAYGMGEAFKVLLQHKGLENPELMCLRDFRSLIPSGEGEMTNE